MFMWCSLKKNKTEQACFLPPTSNTDQIKNTETQQMGGGLLVHAQPIHISTLEGPAAGNPSLGNLCYLEPLFTSSCIKSWCEYVADCDFGLVKIILLLPSFRINIFFFRQSRIIDTSKQKYTLKLTKSENLRQLLVFSDLQFKGWRVTSVFILLSLLLLTAKIMANNYWCKKKNQYLVDIHVDRCHYVHI